MSDATLAAISGSLIILAQIVVIRILDYYMPKGRISKKALKNSVSIDGDENKNMDGEDSHE